MDNSYTNLKVFTPPCVSQQGEAMNFPINQYFYSSSEVNIPTYCVLPVDQIRTEPWIESWLSKIGKTQTNIPITPKKSNISLTAARKSLKGCLDILNKLAGISDDLRTNVQKLSSSEWKKKTIKIGHLKENFSNVMNSISNPDVLGTLQKNIKLRKKKRLNQKKKRIQRAVNKKKEIEEQRNIDKHINRWLEVKKEEDDRIKMEETMNKDVDCVLSEVNRMKSDAKKNLSLIRALVKLRHVRETMYAQRGEKTSLEDKQAFTANTEKMLKIWENALKQYNTEEHMLKTMLEKTASDNMKHKELLREKETLSNWEVVIFGNKTVGPSETASFLALTAAERDLETFVAIRKSWDTFLVSTDGSSLPIGWVLPPTESNKNWEKYILH